MLTQKQSVLRTYQDLLSNAERGKPSKCPICGLDYYKDCPHSIHSITVFCAALRKHLHMEQQGIAEYEAEIQRMKKALRGMTHHMQQIDDQRKYYNRVSCELSDKLEEQRNEIHELRMKLDRR